MQSAQCAVESRTGQLRADLRRTVVITDPEVFQNDAFSLERTLGAILTSAVKENPQDAAATEAQKKLVNTPAERISLLTSMIRSFRVADRVNPDSKVAMPARLRPNEAALDPLKLLTPQDADGMRPVGLFNRLDLAPANFKYCGEHRIVYAKGDPVGPTNRFLLIFEAAVDNPDPQNRPEGCLGIAQFWDSLKGKTGQQLRTALEKFYYEGDTNGDGTPDIQPVVHHQHFGLPFGQVRGNLFVTGGDVANNPWMLREWRVSVSPDGSAVFVPDTVKANPHPALYGTAAANEVEGFGDLRFDFQDDFVRVHVRELIEQDLQAQREGKTPTPTELFAGVGARFSNRFNTFESVSQGEGDDPLKRAENTGLPAGIDTELKNFKLPQGSTLTAQHILARAGAVSCGGCHQFSVGQEIAPNVKWPATTSGRFTHVTEKRELSEALEKHFLPARCENLNNFLKQVAPTTITVASGPTTSVSASAQRAAAPTPSQPAPTSPVDMAASATQGPPTAAAKARQALTRVAPAESRLERLEAVRNLEEQVQTARRQDRQEAGAFMTYRRPH
ncbi:hypothetical protein [Microvirga massiliensis]|uniref:hypothetical protein n=1 Tax=Microvirga massiliensis TaxID=1033741 RepID=UPI00062B9ADC|nr:hypothetical protein [Microvirga massiliensis]